MYKVTTNEGHSSELETIDDLFASSIARDLGLNKTNTVLLNEENGTIIVLRKEGIRQHLIEIIDSNIWEFRCDALCIPTNGDTNRFGKAVMGRGVALQAKQMFPGIDKVLGDKLLDKGNIVHKLGKWNDIDIYSFPTKHHWDEKADLDLIEESLKQIVIITDKEGYKTVIMPRPGCGNGQLEWSGVKRTCEQYLDDRFGVITDGT